MPSLSHDILVELFRNRPRLGGELLHACAGIDLSGDTVELGSSDLSQVVPTEFRADAVIVFRDRDKKAVAALVVEVQRTRDRDKRRTWPVYVAVLRARHDCPVTLLVIAPDPAVAQWARRPIELGHPGFTLHPLVASHDNIPKLEGLDEAKRAPELTVLSAIVHPELQIARAALAAIPLLPTDQQKVIFETVMLNLPQTVQRRLLEDAMEGRYQPIDWMQELYEKGLRAGRQEGREGVVTLLREKFAIVDAAIEEQLRGSERDLRPLIVALAIAADEPTARAELDKWFRAAE